MRVAIFGANDIRTRGYLQALSAFPDVEVVGLIERSAALGKLWTETYDIPHFPDTSALSGQRLDAVIVCASQKERASSIEQALPFTDHILCEVPYALTCADTETINQRCDTQHARLYPAFRFRHLPVFQSLKAMIGQGQLGQPLSVKVQHRAIRTATLLTNMMQVIDLLRWLLDTDMTDQHAETIEGGAILSVALANGAYATLDVSLSLPPTYPAPETLELEIIGTGGWARIDAFRQTIETYAAQGVIQSNWGSDPITELLRAFIADQPMATAQDALRAQTIAQAVFETPETP